MVKDVRGATILEDDYVRIVRGRGHGRIGRVVRIIRGWVWVVFEDGTLKRYRGKELELYRPSFIP